MSIEGVERIENATVALRADRNRLATNRLGLWLFFISESMIFIILLTARFYLLGATRPEGMNQAVGFLLTAVLLISSFFAYRAEVAVRQGDRRMLLFSLLATMALGLFFLAGVLGLEWREAAARGISDQSHFGMAFYSMTGMHAFHVLTGIGLLAVIVSQVRRGAYSPTSYWGVEAVVKYWHFVDLVWVFFYPALYLVT